jgi:NAD(P)-dependent dehydrogenase (short-subunit alcohol dehydrogenase family)
MATNTNTKPAAGAALVTGGGKRIGREIALMLGARGRSVAVHCNSSLSEAEATVAEIVAAGGKAAVVQADLTQASAAAGLVDAASAAIDEPIDCLINNASIFKNDSPANFSADAFDRNMAIHARAPALLAQAMANRLADDAAGVIVNLLDQKSFNPDPTFFSYTISKFALLGLTQVLARALAPKIRVNGVALGLTLPPETMSDARFRELQERQPLGRGAQPNDVVAAIEFLIDAPAVTGETIIVDGGEHMGGT